jgi:hypothetical protein
VTDFDIPATGSAEVHPEEDPLAADAAALKASRDLLLSVGAVIIPGHGAAFRPGEPV